MLYLTGWHTEVMGRAQQALLATGLFHRSATLPTKPVPKADYSLSLRTLDGEAVSLVQLRGKVILLNL